MATEYERETAMSIFGRRNLERSGRSGVRCPSCGSTSVTAGYVDRITVTVTRACNDCAGRWSEPLIDLTDKERVTSSHR